MSQAAEQPGAPVTLIEHALYYIGLGWALCRIPLGAKGPRNKSWNQPSHYIDSPEKAIAQLSGEVTHGIGLIHAGSGTCAIDVDNLPYFKMILSEFGFDLETVFAGAPRIIGQDDRDKAIFRLPKDVPAQTHKLVWPSSTPDGKPTTIFELRAGAVQDALPPTMHPEAQRPYRWRVAPWELPNGIPELPRPLAELWRNWSALERQLQSLCPWVIPTTALPPLTPLRTCDGEHSDVIGQFCEAHDLRTMLEHYGYVRKGRRYLAPTSSTGLAGVTLFEGETHCFSHHASDPLNDGHRHDAFDLFCRFEHHGDVTAAVRAAGRMLGIEPKRPDQSPVDANVILESARKRTAVQTNVVNPTPTRMPEISAPPPELLTLPGALGWIVDFANRTAPKPQPLFAVTAALALGSVVLGRRYTTDMQTWSPLYFVNVGKSACGKEHARTVIERVLIAAELAHLIGPSGYTSDGAIFSALLHQPTHLAVIDEFGDLLASAKSEGNHYKRQAITLLMEAWGRVGGTQRAQGYSSMTLSAEQAKALADRKIERPALCVLGMTTPDSFYASLDESSIRGGFLNRLLIVETHIGRQVFGNFVDAEPPRDAIAWCKAARGQGMGNLSHLELGADLVPQANRVPIDPKAYRAWSAYAADCNRAMDKLDSVGLAELHGRSAEKAMRLGLILAVSESVEAPVIREHHIDWAATLVRFATDQTITACQGRMHGSKFSISCARTLEYIRRMDRVNSSLLIKKCRAFGDLDRRQREEVLLALQDSNDIELVPASEFAARGRPGKTYRAVHAPPEDRQGI